MERKIGPLQEKIYSVIFKFDTPAGKAFDIALLVTIVASVLVVMLESIPRLDKYHDVFYVLEWIFTIFFTIEYFLRIYCVYKPKKYIFSFYGIIDLLAILPTYLSLVIASSSYLLIIRALRLLRVFRIFKLAQFLKESTVILKALRASSRRIMVFLFFILLMVTVFGSIMYLVEGTTNKEEFDSIPRAIYWAIVTLTTVGYGDISPNTSIGQFLAAIVMILGYAVIAVPTGIVSSEMVKAGREMQNIKIVRCDKCKNEEHDKDASFCKCCGRPLDES